ncbi:CoA binding protein [Bradyrhizobium macuxiense]|uniref:CoA binding protein n=1 Tax=Bradyrhizobium macuxiense TaxID=1755647 RepID=A0A560L377_9BRAD|nr:acyl-CoA synthetase FdrA [Bradyrhizobium macuxiense]TWB89986.1 CoA binding protein [Bradyrhizobium macuxiense]
MAIQSSIKANLYKDSVSLMRISQVTVARTGVQRVTLLMGTRSNKEFLQQAGLMGPALEGAKPGDIMIVVADDAGEKRAAAEQEIHSLIVGEEPKGGSAEAAADAPPRSISRGVAIADHADLAMISVPGPYAAAEALKALRRGLNVLLFSDNVPIEQEQAIKRVAARKGLLVMGPDCGTAIINGVPLGFANVVRRGAIGLVGASGTGLQEVMCQIHRHGQGISQAIGTGSHDVSSEVGGITMLQGLDLLAADAQTKVVAIVSKPPAGDVQKRVIERAGAIGKPVVICFLGGEPAASAGNVHRTSSLEETARQAVALAGERQPGGDEQSIEALATRVCASLAPSQRYLRGLYSGGTFCSEAQTIWRAAGLRVRSNAPLAEADRLADVEASQGHTAIDLGSDEFTVGRPHPMIDHGVRIERLLKEADDSTVACIVLDVVLGYGSHPNPAEMLAPAIRRAKAAARGQGRELPVICFVCGTDTDPQAYETQKAMLADAGAELVGSSTGAARAAQAIASRMAADDNATARRVMQGGER